MATIYKVLGQADTSATTATNIYTVPSSTEAIISTIVVANRASTAASFRLSVRPNGETQSNKHYLAFDVPIAGNDSTTLTLGITLGDTDVITAYASTTNLSWNVFGTEITP
jgi:glucose-6-phosphate dehydrogenase assembly protein OpcA